MLHFYCLPLLPSLFSAAHAEDFISSETLLPRSFSYSGVAQRSPNNGSLSHIFQRHEGAYGSSARECVDTDLERVAQLLVLAAVAVNVVAAGISSVRMVDAALPCE